MSSRRTRSLILALELLLLAATTSCASSSASESEHDAMARAALIEFDPNVGAGIEPEIDAVTREAEYALVYCVSDDGAAITTSYRGASEAFSAGVGTERVRTGEWNELVARVGLTGYRVVLARWTCEANGKIARAYVRTEPLIEVRAVEPVGILAEVEWRPLVDGRGSGAWRSAR
jgi:hypothetical protein